MNTYRTTEVATAIGIHPNTVRLYEELGLIPTPERESNGYRIFTKFHIQQFLLARTAFQIEVLQGGLRKKIISVIKLSAHKKFDEALILTQEYLEGVRMERNNAEEAIQIVQDILSGEIEEHRFSMKRKEVSEYLDISMDTLRNWEMNGLLTVKRKENGYRVYTDEDIKRLKIIRSLRCAKYSLEAILRMLRQLSKNPDIDIKAALNTPRQSEDIISVCDQLIISLTAAERNAEKIMEMLHRHGTSVRIIISPDYDQKELHPDDREILQNIIGEENVYDFSGINEFTKDYHNYYEAGHYRPLLGNKLLERVYKDQ